MTQPQLLLPCRKEILCPAAAVALWNKPSTAPGLSTETGWRTTHFCYFTSHQAHEASCRAKIPLGAMNFLQQSLSKNQSDTEQVSGGLFLPSVIMNPRNLGLTMLPAQHLSLTVLRSSCTWALFRIFSFATLPQDSCQKESPSQLLRIEWHLVVSSFVHHWQIKISQKSLG